MTDANQHRIMITMKRRTLVLLVCGTLVLLCIICRSIVDPPSKHNILELIRQVTSSVAENGQACTPREYAFYLKVPKTGSSTIAGILHRWGIRHNLTAVPVLGNPWHKDSGGIIENCLVPPNGSLDLGLYNYFEGIYIYRDEEVQKVMHKDSAYIASMRHPLKQIRSRFQESKLGSPGDPDPVRSMLEKLPGPIPKRTRKWTQNQQSRIFGLSEESARGNSLEDLAQQRQVLELADARFDLVLITEYLDESLVLLRRKMCWEIQDIIYLPLRVRKYIKDAILPSDLEEKHRQYSRSDYKFYAYFKDKLIRDIRMASGNFAEEVTKFKEIVNNVFDFCTPLMKQMEQVLKARRKNDQHGNSSGVFLKLEQSQLAVNPYPFGSAFAVTGMDCAFLAVKIHVRRLLVLTRQNPWLCTIQHPPHVHQWNTDYCKDIHPRLGVSMRVMATYSSYVVDGTSIQKV